MRMKKSRSRMTSSIWLSSTLRIYFQSLLHLGFLDPVLSDFQLRGWPSTVISEGHLTNSHKDGKVIKRSLFWSSKTRPDWRTSKSCGAIMGLSTSSGSGQLFRAVSLSKTIPLGYELSALCPFSLPCVRSRVLLQRFHMILGPGGFHQERIAMKQQTRSLAELSWEKWSLVW